MTIIAIKWTFGLAAIIVISSLVGCGALNIVLLRCKNETFNNQFLCLYKKKLFSFDFVTKICASNNIFITFATKSAK